MRHHRPLRPCGIRAPRRLTFGARPCRRLPRRRVCCQVLHLTGELDAAATPTLLVAVGRALDARSGCEGPGLVLDLDGLTFCDAAGLSGLLRARRLTEEAGTSVYLTAPPRRFSRILAVCDLERTFPLHPSALGPRRPCSARRTRRHGRSPENSATPTFESDVRGQTPVDRM